MKIYHLYLNSLFYQYIFTTLPMVRKTSVVTFCGPWNFIIGFLVHHLKSSGKAALVSTVSKRPCLASYHASFNTGKSSDYQLTSEERILREKYKRSHTYSNTDREIR